MAHHLRGVWPKEQPPTYGPFLCTSNIESLLILPIAVEFCETLAKTQLMIIHHKDHLFTPFQHEKNNTPIRPRHV